MDYYTQKAKRMYELHLKGEICKKVYAAVHIDDKYAVLENGKGRKFKYQLLVEELKMGKQINKQL